MSICRLSRCLLIVLGCVLLGMTPALAQDAVHFSIGEEKINEDGTVKVPIRVEGFKDVTGAQFTLRWDPEVLRFTSTEAYNLPGLRASNFGAPQSENIPDGTLTIVWDDPEGKGKTLTDGTAMFTVVFDAVGPTEASTNIVFSDDPTVSAVYVGLAAVPFIADDGTAALPVELSSFTARTTGRDVVLMWQTESESRNAGFAIEYRAKTNQHNAAPFHQAGFLEGEGTTNIPQQYTCRIADLQPGVYQFRLKQVDTDGGATYGPTIETRVTLASSYELSEANRNPFRTQTQLQLTMNTAQHVTATAYNALGQRVATLHQGMLPAQTRKTLTFDGAGLSSGVYWIRVQGEAFTAARTVVLAR